jgi:HPr kinase/phosphorylase
MQNQFSNLEIIKKEHIFVSLIAKSPIKPVSLLGETGFDNKLQSKHIHRPQLALTGYVELFSFKSVQLFGNTEMYYLKSLKKADRIKAFEKICKFRLPCIILTNNHIFDDDMLEICKKYEIAVFQTKYESTKASAILSDFLDDQFIEQTMLHGSFVDVYGVGMLFVGRSGIGKSEVALDLIERGHRLVADDIVMINKKGETTLMGTGTSLVQHFMEIRGLGIIDVRQMFGIRSIRFQKRLEIIVELEEWNDQTEYTRTGLEQIPTEVLGVEINNVKLPIIPGKNVTVIAEVIALNYLLKTYGYDAAEVFANKLSERIKNKSNEERIVNYFQGDIE